MKQVENECVGCELPCIGPACRYRNVIRYYCDECGDEIGPDDMYRVDNEDLCEYCLKNRFRVEE